MHIHILLDDWKSCGLETIQIWAQHFPKPRPCDPALLGLHLFSTLGFFQAQSLAVANPGGSQSIPYIHT